MSLSSPWQPGWDLNPWPLPWGNHCFNISYNKLKNVQFLKINKWIFDRTAVLRWAMTVWASLTSWVQKETPVERLFSRGLLRSRMERGWDLSSPSFSSSFLSVSTKQKEKTGDELLAAEQNVCSLYASSAVIPPQHLLFWLQQSTKPQTVIPAKHQMGMDKAITRLLHDRENNLAQVHRRRKDSFGHGRTKQPVFPSFCWTDLSRLLFSQGCFMGLYIKRRAT